MEFVPYDQFKNIEFIAEGGFSKIYKATWIDGPLNNSNNITFKELNELKIFYELSSKTNTTYVCNYFGITQDPNSQDVIIIMPYYNSVAIGDLGISKSATESGDDNNDENYGIIPYMAPEALQGQKYTKASDIYSFGMIMWELMTGRRPFWDRDHDTGLIINIYDGLRPPIVTNAPEGYIELMEECWHSDPDKRPQITDIKERIGRMYSKEYDLEYNKKNPTEIIESLDIGPVPKNNPGAIYKSRPLSAMINSAMSLRSSRSQSINLEKVKRKFEDDLIEDNDDGRNIKRNKLYENEDYLTKEIELDIDTNYNNNEYITTEIDFDI
ncbi:unnamed protein product [Rhizophagus irregularis]|nr:unnamed protein product [Rhizophagus irregularis]